ncbi:nucleotidyltransferase domain-containing protein [Noviherbaspirillum sp.]|uniref:nucleotidyltransferase domain-containing protein n=1 Tax=Noviherbaspirillum sp. TaxID=1926288 RepID=UPI002FE350F7
MKTDALILKAFREPQSISTFRLPDWDLLIRQARRGNVLASLHAMLAERGLLGAVPAQAREHLEWSWIAAVRHSEAVRWEVRFIRKALMDVGVPLILLKGAAYVMADLPPARGRVFSDIDILVPKSSLNAVEAGLMMHGWASMHQDDYDQRYYRKWMHELPPMQHIKRMTSIDVHHAIVPETAPIRPDSEKLRSAAVSIDASEKLLVLSPVDMVLHSAVHLFHDGEFDHALRDLIDIHRLLDHFGQSPSFWSSLAPRAQELELMRPLFYALRYSGRLLGTPVSVEATRACDIAAPNGPLLALMDSLFLRALLPDHTSCSDGFSGSARQALYLRANWLRMPPLLLMRHLFHKAFLSPKKE